MTFKVVRYHDFSAGHRVYGHESKCAHLHGHNYRVYFHCSGGLDSLGRVVDFSVIKSKLCMWLEDNWDHKFILWDQDPIVKSMRAIDMEGVVLVPFNPTAENMAKHLVKVIGPQQLTIHGLDLTEVIVEETRKCSAGYEL